jgi:hypothetical protein
VKENDARTNALVTYFDELILVHNDFIINMAIRWRGHLTIYFYYKDEWGIERALLDAQKSAHN